jgi:hypothetical protein
VTTVEKLCPNEVVVVVVEHLVHRLVPDAIHVADVTTIPKLCPSDDPVVVEQPVREHL